MAFLDFEHFWMRTLRGQIHRTTNGGRTFDVFTPDLVDPFTGARVTSWVDTSMQFVSNTVGYAVCAANVQKTTDGGKTWVARPVPRALGAVTQVWFFDESIGIAVAGRGFEGIVRTTNGGQSWAGVPNAPSFDKLTCTRDGFCAGLGLRPHGGSFVRWGRRTYAPPYEFSGVYFLDASRGWLTARDSKHRLYRTTDGGKTLNYVADYFHDIEAQTPSPTPRSDVTTSIRGSYELQP